MTISISGSGQDGETKYSVSGSVSQSDWGTSISLSLVKQEPVVNPSPVVPGPGEAEAQEMPPVSQ